MQQIFPLDLFVIIRREMNDRDRKVIEVQENDFVNILGVHDNLTDQIYLHRDW